MRATTLLAAAAATASAVLWTLVAALVDRTLLVLAVLALAVVLDADRLAARRGLERVCPVVVRPSDGELLEEAGSSQRGSRVGHGLVCSSLPLLLACCLVGCSLAHGRERLCPPLAQLRVQPQSCEWPQLGGCLCRGARAREGLRRLRLVYRCERARQLAHRLREECEQLRHRQLERSRRLVRCLSAQSEREQDGLLRGGERAAQLRVGAKAERGQRRREVCDQVVVHHVACVGAQSLHVVGGEQHVELLRREAAEGALSRDGGSPVGVHGLQQCEGREDIRRSLEDGAGAEVHEPPAEVGVEGAQPIACGACLAPRQVREHEQGMFARRVVGLLPQVDGREAGLAPELQQLVVEAEGGAHVVEAGSLHFAQAAEQRRQRVGRSRLDRLGQQPPYASLLGSLANGQ
mmetsp:Transcript_27095/g.68500  ORF Transcript_27095/g.68500 Transcript_27095/m.68500 type:complete len:406 (+) Transcript_27095:148-1365(+)